jgi:hypothetical protein
MELVGRLRGDGRCNTDRSECIVCAEERRELSLPAAGGGLKTMGYGRMATHRPGGVLLGGHSPSLYSAGYYNLYSKSKSWCRRCAIITSSLGTS